MANNPNHKPVSSKAAQTARSGRATTSPPIENTAVSPSGGPSSDDCYTTLLHNSDPEPGPSVSKRSGKRSGGCPSLQCIGIQELPPPQEPAVHLG